MRRRITFVVLGGLAAVLATVCAAASARGAAAAPGITVMGPYGGSARQSFEAVLDGFRTHSGGTTVAYTPAGANAAAALTDAIKAGHAPDVAVLSLPDESALMQQLAAAGTLHAIGFVAPALDSSYAFTWKTVGSVSGTLYGLPFKATNESAFWYDTALFARSGAKPPTTLAAFHTALNALDNHGISPLSVAGADSRTLADIFRNVYLTQQGPARFDKLAHHQLSWQDASVKAALRTMTRTIVRPGLVAGGVAASLKTGLAGSAMKVFGAPPKAAAVFGGSSVFSVLQSAKAARPAAGFGTFPFPSIGKPPARVIGSTDVVVMLKDTPAARSLIGYLATSDAATIWAKRGGFLSPNKKVALSSYPLAATRDLASMLTNATIFRLEYAPEQSAGFRASLGKALQTYVQNPSKLDAITKEIEAAATKA